MKKNTKIILGSVIGLAVLGAATLALVLTQPKDDTADSDTSSDTSVSITDYETDDISTLTVTNESGEYTINRLGKEKWGIDSIPEALANSSSYSNAMSSAGGMSAKQVVEENATDLVKYGFDKPTATIKMTFKDNKADDVTCLVGIKYEGENSWYVKTDKSNTVYLVSNSGVSFAMNDKCSAGTGRFFEAMARSFEMSLPEFSKLALTAKNVIPITAQCTVFAESEVITLVGEGKPMDEIAAGIQMAVAKRCFVMAKKAGATDSITLTGGCAKNDGLKEAIEHVLKLKVVNLKTDPQLMGALGAAEYARQKGMAKK